MITLPLYDPMILKLIACVALQSSSEHGIRSQIKRTLIICTALFATGPHFMHRCSGPYLKNHNSQLNVSCQLVGLNLPIKIGPTTVMKISLNL